MSGYWQFTQIPQSMDVLHRFLVTAVNGDTMEGPKEVNH